MACPATLSGLAGELGVSVDQLRCTVPAENECKEQGCTKVAVLGNRNYGVWHRQGWFPTGHSLGKSPAGASVHAHILQRAALLLPPSNVPFHWILRSWSLLPAVAHNTGVLKCR